MMDINLFLPIFYLVLFSLLCTLMLVFTSLYAYTLIDGVIYDCRGNRKSRERIKKLTKKADTDRIARVELERIKRKFERRKKRNKIDTVKGFALLALFMTVLILSFSFTVVPISIDLIHKDYVLYEGEIVVHDGRPRYAMIELEDGTMLKGNSIFLRNDTYGTLIYTKRSKLIIAAEK